jgi:hypothetical protein
MADIELKPEEQKKEPLKSEGTPLNLGNVEIIKVKLLESIQNLLLENNKILRAIAIKQGAIEVEKPKTDV